MSQLDSSTLNILLFASAMLLALGYWVYRFGKNQVTQLDATWKRHVKNLRTQGIDPSYIKRTPEWEKVQIREAKFNMIVGISIAIIMPILTIGFVVARALF